MKSDWYFSIQGEKHGPVDFKSLIQMAAKAELQPTDLIWQRGMTEWVAASSNQDLFPEESTDEPPALPSNKWDWERIRDTFDKLYANKTVFFGACCAICVLGAVGMFALSAISAAIGIEPLAGVFLFIGVWFPLGALAFFVASIKPFVESLRKRDLLVGKWELVDGEGPAIQLTEDGGFLRLDGIAGNYEYSVAKQTLRISLDQVAPTKLQVISVSKHELIVSDGTATQHYQRGETITEAEFRKEMEQAKAALGKAAATAGKAAVVVGGVAAAVGIGVLGVAAAGAASGSGGSNSKLPCPRCGYMYSTGLLARDDCCQNCRAPLPGR